MLCLFERKTLKFIHIPKRRQTGTIISSSTDYETYYLQ